MATQLLPAAALLTVIYGLISIQTFEVVNVKSGMFLLFGAGKLQRFHQKVAILAARTISSLLHRSGYFNSGSPR